ncbi:N-acetylmuramoyl-L-alanine amidase [Micromonospora sp. DT81.3]|uniref:N-acetylmuramoyl-L-alanine amidase n=1 Tax=Micromonospora sp. DT81.3 TaxID=3416523 RepID=UPI003CE93596
MVIDTCTKADDASSALFAQFELKISAARALRDDCIGEAQARFDAAVASGKPPFAQASARFVKEKKACSDAFEEARRPLDKKLDKDLKRIREEAKSNLAVLDRLLITTEALEPLAKKLSRVNWATGVGPVEEPARIHTVGSFAELKREMSADRCLAHLMLVLEAEAEELVFGSTRRSVTAFVNGLPSKPRLRSGDSLFIEGQLIGSEPSDVALLRDAVSVGPIGFHVNWTKVGPILELTAINKLLPTDKVAQCKVRLTGNATVWTTDNKGRATINLPALADNTYDLKFEPADALPNSQEVGPKTLPTVAPMQRMWRPLNGNLTIRAGKVVAVGGDLTLKGKKLTAELQPVFMKSPRFTKRTKPRDLIVVHHTDSLNTPVILKKFMRNMPGNADYFIDIDGQVVKLVEDADHAEHAGISSWGGQLANNSRSFGIEIQHENDPDAENPTRPYLPAQMKSLKRLLSDLASHWSISTKSIIGHSDLATGIASGQICVGRKGGDPGFMFDWSDLAAAGLGIPIRSGPQKPTPLSKLFLLFPTLILQKKDSDSGKIYGGIRLPAAPAGAIASLQKQLEKIGYLCPVTGTYDLPTRRAVRIFQQHFMSGVGNFPARPPKPDLVDGTTADLIQRVA